MDSGGKGHSEVLGLLASMSSCLAKGHLFAEAYRTQSKPAKRLVRFIVHREVTPVHLCDL